jgi:Transposase DDE domain group 1
MTQCTHAAFDFHDLGRRSVQAGFDGGHITSEGGALLLREVERRSGIIARTAACFKDFRDPDVIEHTLGSLVAQRVYGLALGYEDLNDHDQLRSDPLLAVLAECADPTGSERRRQQDKGCALAGKSTLNRLELSPADATANSRYKKIVYDEHAFENLFVDLFVDSHQSPPDQIVLDLDATDDPTHGNQEGRFFHGYYKNYCYLPLYIFCGEQLLCAKLRTADRDAADGSLEEVQRIVARIRARWPNVKIILRGDSGFCRDALMDWCEKNSVQYVFGLARNKRLETELYHVMGAARVRWALTGQAARFFKDFTYQTRDSWSCPRRVIGKAEYLDKGENPRFIVTNIPSAEMQARAMYEDFYCARGDMENRIKEQQMYLFADRTSTATMRANQLRLWFSSVAYTLMQTLRSVGLKDTPMAKAQCGTIRLKLLKIGALVKVTVRRVVISMAAGCPYQKIFEQAFRALQGMPLRC